MAEVELIIKISEKCYNDICNSETVSNYSVLNALDGVRNGTPLSKGVSNSCKLSNQI